jgi:hypothetical protein
VAVAIATAQATPKSQRPHPSTRNIVLFIGLGRRFERGPAIARLRPTTRIMRCGPPG